MGRFWRTVEAIGIWLHIKACMHLPPPEGVDFSEPWRDEHPDESAAVAAAQTIGQGRAWAAQKKRPADKKSRKNGHVPGGPE